MSKNDATPKTFLLKPEQVERLIEDERACLATDRIVVDGAPVGYMYREESSADEDSGWRFMAGDESTAYMANADNIGVYALNSLANYDRDIIALLTAEPGAYFARPDPSEPFVQLTDGDLDPSASDPHDDYPELAADFPVVNGRYELTQRWQLTAPVPFNRRIEDGTMVLWRPGATVQIVAWDITPDESIEDRLDQLLTSVSPNATDIARVDEDGFVRMTYRIPEGETGTIATFVVDGESQLLAHVQYDDTSSQPMVEKLIASFDRRDETDQ